MYPSSVKSGLSSTVTNRSSKTCATGSVAMACALAWVLVAMVMRDTLRVREAGVEACDAPESGEANVCGKGGDGVLSSDCGAVSFQCC
jgi:hypothetical protein